MAMFDREFERMVLEAKTVADSLRLRASSIDEIIKRMEESKDPAAAYQVIEQVQSAVANSHIDKLFQQAVRAVRAEQELQD